MLKTKGKNKWPETAMLLLFLVVIIIKIVISFQNSSLNHESYYHLSQAKTILEQGKPGMQNYVYDNSALPIVDYVLAFFGLFFNLEFISKILINVLVSSIIIIVYYLIYEFTKEKRISFFGSIFAAFIPMLFKTTVNNFSSSGISLFLYMITLLFFIKSMNNPKLIRHFIIFLILLIFITPISIIFIASFVIYFILLKAEKMRIRLSEVETFLFSLVLGGWIYIIIYKNAIIQKGILFFLHPTIASTTSELTLSSLALIGIIPIILGILGVYTNLVKKSNRQIIFISSFVISTIIFMIFNLITNEFALSLTALGLIVCSGITLHEWGKFFEESKVKRFYNILLAIGLILFVLTSIIPSLTGGIIDAHNVPTQKDKEAFIWAKENIPEGSIITTGIQETYVSVYFSGRENVMQKYKTDDKTKLTDIKDFYKLTLNTESIRILSFYDIDHVILSESTIKKINKKVLGKFDDECYNQVYEDKAEIYKSLCTIEKEEKLNKEIFD